MDLAGLNLLTLNAGSSSLKVRMLKSGETVASAGLSAGPSGWEELEKLLDAWPEFGASVHRVVHGGGRFKSGVLVDDEVIAALEELSCLAPLHNPPALAGIRAVRRLRPGLPAVACFDTSFHSTIGPEAASYGIPWEWTEKLGVRRYGFHGLSHSYAFRRSAALLGRPASQLRIVTCHLGAGASLAAVSGGRSVDTTMGFTPLEGLIMATRSGTVDPGAVLWLQQELGLSAGSMADTLEHSSGLLGMSGRSGDMRKILDLAGRGEIRARVALAAYVHRIRSGIGAMAAAMGGVDAVTFTGGVGEASPRIREMACGELQFLGLVIDLRKNEQSRGDADISAAASRTRVLVVQAREDLEMAAEAMAVLGRAGTVG